MESTSATDDDESRHSKQQKKQQQQPTLLTPVVWCILITETGERFAYYGFRAILVLYFTTQLHYDDNSSIALFAYTTALAYLSPVGGAVLADGSWGRYYTILVFGMVYVVGLLILTLAALWSESLEQSAQRFFSLLGLALVCLGTGGIKPCVSSFGADQVGTMKKSVSNSSNWHQLSHSQEEHDLVQSVVDPRVDLGESSCNYPENYNGSNCYNSKNRNELIRAFFAYFYFCINVGAVTSIAIIPLIRAQFGFGVAFMIPTLFMNTAMGLFFSMRHHYVHHVPGKGGSSLSTTFRLSWWLLKKELWVYLPPGLLRLFSCLRPGPQPVLSHDQVLFTPIRDHDSNDGKETNDAAQNDNDLILKWQMDDARQGLNVLPVMALLPIFWCLYDQQSSVWTLQATRMNLHGLQPEQLNVVNPIQIMIFIPLFDRGIYPWMERHRYDIRPLRRMSYGMLLAALAFFISGLVESSIQRQEIANQPSISVFYQLPQITLLSIAEIFVSVTGLEFAYATSPDRLKAFLMALFLLTTAVGDFLSGVLYSTVFTAMNRATVMHICGLLMLGNLLVFRRVAQWREQLQPTGLEHDDVSETLSLDGLEIQERQHFV